MAKAQQDWPGRFRSGQLSVRSKAEGYVMGLYVSFRVRSIIRGMLHFESDVYVNESAIRPWSAESAGDSHFPRACPRLRTQCVQIRDDGCLHAGTLKLHAGNRGWFGWNRWHWQPL